MVDPINGDKPALSSFHPRQPSQGREDWVVGSRFEATPQLAADIDSCPFQKELVSPGAGPIEDLR
jgi:hypothetical protein